MELDCDCDFHDGSELFGARLHVRGTSWAVFATETLASDKYTPPLPFTLAFHFTSHLNLLYPLSVSKRIFESSLNLRAFMSVVPNVPSDQTARPHQIASCLDHGEPCACIHEKTKSLRIGDPANSGLSTTQLSA